MDVGYIFNKLSAGSQIKLDSVVLFRRNTVNQCLGESFDFSQFFKQSPRLSQGFFSMTRAN